MINVTVVKQETGKEGNSSLTLPWLKGHQKGSSLGVGLKDTSP